jgi:hypothetical protein
MNCASDILNIIPKQKDYCKEITESMSIIKRLRDIVLKDKMKYTIIDLFAGNALTSVISAFLFFIKKSIAIDKKKRIGNYDQVKRFEYIESDIVHDSYVDNLLLNNEKELFILTGVHVCGDSCFKMIDLFNQYKQVKRMYLMPCCIGNLSKADNFIMNKLGKYIAWSYILKDRIQANVKLYEDRNNMSPANIIIEAWRE